MAERLDVLHGREGGEKTYWTKIGVPGTISFWTISLLARTTGDSSR